MRLEKKFLDWKQWIDIGNIILRLETYSAHWLSLIDSLTPIGNILGPSPSVIFGNKIQKIFSLWRFWWRHTSNIWNLVIISQNSKGYSTYTRNILSTWRHHRQKFALDFVSENDARWKTQFLDFVSEICQYGLNQRVLLWKKWNHSFLLDTGAVRRGSINLIS